MGIRFKVEGLEISREVRWETKDAGSWRIALQSIYLTRTKVL